MNRRTIRMAYVVALILGLLGAGSSGVAAADAEGAWFGMPFAGRWAIDAGQTPADHWTPNNGDWAIDLFAKDTSIRVAVGGATGAVSLYAYRSASCGGTGSRVLVTVRVDGVEIGWISYSHLDAAVPTGPIGNGTVVGRTRRWPYVQDCWEVTSDAGVHTHVEARNTSGYSCWTRRTVGSTLPYGATIGHLGSPAASAKRAACSTAGPSSVAPSTGGVTEGARFVGDWDGNGSTTVGVVYRTSTGLQWHLRNSNSPGSAALIFNYGLATDIPVVGNWDGVGGDTIGIARRTSTGLQWHLRNSNSGGSATWVFSYGARTDTPVVGNWDGRGSDTVGIARVVSGGLQWHLRNANTGGSAHLIFYYGTGTDMPLSGNWDAVGGDTIGIARYVSGGLQWHLRNANSGGSAHAVFAYGTSTDVPVVGNWDRAGGDTIGALRRTSTGMQWHLRNHNSAGPAQAIFYYGSGTQSLT